MRFLFGEVSGMDAVGTSHEYPEIDDFSVLLRFASGMHATLASSADASWLFPFERVEVFCHHATITTREMESIAYSEDLMGGTGLDRCTARPGKKSGDTRRRIARSWIQS